MTKAVEENQVSVSGDSDAGRRSEVYPKKFGHYEILRELGRGGMATVYEAMDTKLQRKVALKVPHKSVAADPEYMSRFIREARSAANLLHPNICPVFEVGDINGTPYLTMAFIDGKNLSDYIVDEHPIPAKRTANFIRKIALAMEVAHKQGIIHRDLKPSNIMIDSRKEPVIMDFGLARRDTGQEESKLTQDGLLIGTPIYMAPEVAKKGAALSGTITDVYSLGAILYEMLAGKPPYKGTVQAVLVQVMRGTPKLPSAHREDLDPAVEAICLKAIAKEPQDRYQSMGELAAALKEYLQKPEQSATSTLVEVVEPELTPPPPRKRDSDPGRTPTERRSAVDRSPSPTRNASVASARRVPPRPRPQTQNTALLISLLVGGSLLAIGLLITLIVVLKGKDKDATVATNTDTGQTVAVDGSPNPPPTDVIPQPAPGKDVSKFPLVAVGQAVEPDWREIRIPSNYHGMVKVLFPETDAAGGKYRTVGLQIKVNGKPLISEDAPTDLDPLRWSRDEINAPMQKVRPDFQVPFDQIRNLAGDLKEGSEVELKIFSFIIPAPLPPEEAFRIRQERKITLHIVQPESMP
jgi:serine/threonine protein kinase